MAFLMTILLLLSITIILNIFILIRIRRQEQEATKKEGPKKEGARKYLPLILLNITIAITVTITIKIEISSNQINNQNNNVPSPPPSRPAQDNDQEAAKLKEKLRTPFEGDGFTLKPLRESEMVKDLKGGYYELIIKGPALFPVGEYIINDQDKEYSQPLNHFFDEVITVLRRAHIDHQLFIKGSADKTGNTTFSKNFAIDRYTYREIPYLPYDSQQQQFTQHKQMWAIPGPYANKDLPNLRARYTQESLKSGARQLESTILAGVVTPKLNEPKDRNITILLYIKWPQ